MPRVKRGVASGRKHKELLALTKGHRATRHTSVRRARQSMVKAFTYAYAHRRERKGDMRRLWIVRINAATRAQGMNYAEFIDLMKRSGVAVNRKMLADMAVKDPAGLTTLITSAKEKAAAAK